MPTSSPKSTPGADTLGPRPGARCPSEASDRTLLRRTDVDASFTAGTVQFRSNVLRFAEPLEFFASNANVSVFVVPAAGGAPVDVSPGDFDVPPIALGGSQDYVFSPDGSEIAFVRNTDPEFRLGLGTNNDIFLTATAGGEAKKLTTNKANDHSPRYSPDGRYLAYLAMARPGFEAELPPEACCIGVFVNRDLVSAANMMRRWSRNGR